MKAIKQERTLVLVKPDGVKRGLTGEVIRRIEQRGLKVIALKMVVVDRRHVEQHLPSDPEWAKRLGDKSLKTFTEYDLDPVKHMGTKDRAKIGQDVKSWVLDYLTSGPMVAMIVEGTHAVDMVRKLAGNTLPVFAEMGTIRGDYSVDSPAVANLEKRSVHNMLHASETPAEAKNEIALWFKPAELHDYRRTEEDLMG